MNYNQIAILLLEGTLVAFLILLLFRRRKKLGIGVLFACLGLFQFVQVYLSSTVYVSITNNIIVSPGSSVFFTATLFALLIIYIKEDASETKKIIYALFIVNIVMSVLLKVLGWHLNEASTNNLFNASTALFNTTALVLFVGTIALFLDSLLIIVIFEFISKKIRFLFLQIFITMFIVVSFDTLFFSILVFWNDEKLQTIITSGLISKGFFALFYSILFYFYIKYFDFIDKDLVHIKIKDVFKALSYKQKFESAVNEIIKVEEERKLELINSNKEKEIRIEELELSKLKIQTTLELLIKSESSKNEVSKVAKIGYWEEDFTSNKVVWSDYVYQIFEVNPTDGIPENSFIVEKFDKEYQEKLIKIRQDITFKGIPYDVELKFINLKKEDVWVRFVAQPVFNSQNEIIGRKGVLQDITDSKLAQLEIESSKQKIQTSLELLEKSERFKNEASKIAKIGYWSYDSITDCVEWSDYVFQIFGFKPQKIAPLLNETSKFFNEEYQKKIAQVTLDVSTKGIPYDVELKFINNKNEEVWIRTKCQPIYNEHNEIVGRGGITQDITASKKAQLELEHSKQKIQTSLKLLKESEYSKNEGSKIAKIGYWEHCLVSDKVKWSDYLYQIFEANPKDGVPSQNEIIKRFDKESQEKLAQATLDITSKGVNYDIELKFVNLKNEDVWLRNVAQPIYNEQNEIVGKRGVMQNITASKKAQLELELSKQKIQTTLELLEKSEYIKSEGNKMAKIGYLEHDLATNIFGWSDTVYQFFGLKPSDEIPSRDEILKLYDKESQEKLEKVNLALITKGVSYDVDLRIINLKKEEVWVRNVVQAVYNQQNKIVGRRGVMHDITASKNAQFALEQSKKEIQNSLDLLEKSKYSMDEASKVAKIGYFEHYIITNIFKWSDYLFYIHGFDPKKPVPSKEEFIQQLDKESIEVLNKATLNLYTKGVSYDIEMKIFNKIENKNIWVRSVAQPIYNEKNEIIGRRGVTQDITASKKAQLALELSKKEIKTSLDLLEFRKYSMDEASKVAKIGYHDYDIATDTFIWSDYLYYIFGLDPKADSLVRKDILNFFDEESKEKMIKATLDLDSKGIPYDLELKIINGRNEEVWVRNVAEPIFNEQNEVIGRRGVSQDITSAKKAQLELEVSKQEVETALELLEKSEYSKNEASKVAKIGFMEYDNATDVFKWSEYLYNLYGLDPTKKVPPIKEITPYFDEESKQKMKVATMALERDGVPYDLELKLVNQKKKTVWMRLVVQPVYNEQQEVIGRRGVSQDITESKKAQLALELSKKEIQTTLELLEKSEYSKNEASKTAKIGFFEDDIVKDTRVWSDYLYEIFGLTPKEEIPSKKELASLMLSEEAQKKLGELVLKLDTKGISFDVEMEMINLRKEDIWVRFIAQPVYNSQNKIVKRRGVMQDITGSKKTQQEIEIAKQKIETTLDLVKENEYSLREAGRMAKIGYWSYDKQTDTIFWSKAVHEIYGNDPKDGIPEIDIILSCFNEESSKKLVDATVLLATKGVPFEIELELTNLKNEKRWILNMGEAIFNDKKEVIGRRGVSQDITQRKLAQNELDYQNEKLFELNNALTMAQGLAHVGNWSFHLSSHITEWSDETFRIWGFNLEEPTPGIDAILKRIHIDDLELFNKTAYLAVNQGIPYDIEFRIYQSNQEQKILRSICQPLFDGDGKVVSLRGTNQDITAQKRAMHEIEKAEEMYRILTDNSNDLICLQEPDGTFKYISPSIKTLLGYEPSDFLGKNAFSIIHKEDVNRLKNVIKKRTFSRDYSKAISFRIRHKEEHFVWLEFLSSPVYKDKEISYFVTTSRDITLSIKAEKEIQQYQTSLQKMTTEMTMIEEKQKKEIASNIHDHLSQSLVISKMRINQLKKNPQLKFIDEDLMFIETHISEALENSRKITYELSPPVLYQLGIIDALNWLLDDVEATHKISYQFNSNVNSIKLSDVKSILLYRSIQEVIKNAIKYADASLITLNFDKDDLGIYILIYDDGVGFDTNVLKNLHNHSGSGFGLFTVQERIKNIQGKFTIESKINVGTSVKIFIPLA